MALTVQDHGIRGVVLVEIWGLWVRRGLVATSKMMDGLASSPSADLIVTAETQP
jgi:hypothetical protein